MAERQVVEGEFAAGGPGVSTMPIRLVGRGSIAIAPDGLVVIGWRKHVSPLLVLTVIIVLVVAMFAIGMFAGPDVLGEKAGRLKVGTVVALAAGIAAAALLARRSKLQRITFDVPWRAVRKVVLAQDREVIVTIKGSRPDGTLHFVPDDSAKDVHDRIAAGRMILIA